MNSKGSSKQSDKPASRSRKSSFKDWLSRCFSQASFSDSDHDSNSEYVIVNHSVFKIPKNLQTSSKVAHSNPLRGTEEQRTLIIQRGSEKKVNHGYNKKHNRKSPSDRRVASEKKIQTSDRRHDPQKGVSLDEKIYQYIRMKTYERMNPYEMTPNDFLNNISSVFVDNIKDPVPKDPLNRPRIFNRNSRRRRKSEVQVMYEKAKEKEKEQTFANQQRYGHKSTDVHTLRRAAINPAILNDVNKNYSEESLSYRTAIEQDIEAEYDDKVLIWKIVVANDEDEGRE